MLSENEIQEALNASRVVPLTTRNPHGPLGLNQIAAEVGGVRGENPAASVTIPLRPDLWAKLQRLVEAERATGLSAKTPTDFVRGIVEGYLAGLPS